jgi:glutamate synthase domain-containing protein 2
MFSLGCIQALKCNKDTCPTGVTTHNAELQLGLVPSDKAQRVQHYAEHILGEVGVIAHAYGVTEARQLGRHHAQLVDARGIPEPLERLYPSVTQKQELIATAMTGQSDLTQ